MTRDECISFLYDFSLFEDLSEAEVNQLADKLEDRVTRKHHFIYLPEDPCLSLYLLVNGTVKVGTHSDDGKEVIKAILHPNIMFGERGLFGDVHRTDFAKAMDKDVSYYSLKINDFKEIMRGNFDFSMKVFQSLGSKLRFTERRLESLIIQDARTRIIEFIKENARNFGKQVGLELLVKHSLTQQDIANFTGTSRQTVTSVLNDLRKSNQIHFKRKSILIRNMSTLS